MRRAAVTMCKKGVKSGCCLSACTKPCPAV
jgi:hypothetical protein